MSEIDWSLLGPPVDIPGAVLQGYQTGRALRTQREQDSALHALSTNPDDSAAQNALMAVNPELAIHYQRATLEREDALRKGRAREATSGVFRAFAPPTAGVVPSAFPTATAAAPPAMPADAPVAPAGAPPAPVTPAAPPTASPVASPAPPSSVLDPSHPVTQQVGAAVASNRMSPSDAVAELARYADPEQIQQVLGTIKAMDGMRQSQLSEANDAVAVVAQNLLGIPLAERRQALMAQAPQLAQHGVTPEQLASEDLSDASLHGRIGQAIGVKAMVELAQKDRQQTETERHDRAGERAAMIKDVVPGGSVVDFGGGGGVAGGGDPISAGGEGMSPAAASVASTLAAAHLPAPVIAGFMGNFHAEGGWAGAQGDGGSASGIAQLRGERRDNFIRMYGKDPQHASPEDQANFTLWEMQNPQAAGMTVAQRDAILAAKTPAEAATLIDKFYERSSGADRQGRIAAANAFAGRAAPTASGGGRVLYTAPEKPEPGSGLTEASRKFAAAQFLRTGQMPASLGRGGAAQKEILDEAARMASDMHMTVDDVIAGRAGTRADTAALQHLETTSAQVLAFERTAQKNGQLALQLAPKANVGSVPVFNRWVNAGRKEVAGDPDISAFNAAVETFANEYARITASATGGGVTSDSARDHVHAMINSAQAPAQFRAVMTTLFKDMENRRVGLEEERQQLHERIRGGGNPAPVASGGSIQTLSPQQARAAAPGTVYRTTDGRILTR